MNKSITKRVAPGFFVNVLETMTSFLLLIQMLEEDIEKII